jgi:hypothetical protein
MATHIALLIRHYLQGTKLLQARETQTLNGRSDPGDCEMYGAETLTRD